MNSNILEDLERTAARVPDRIAFCDDQNAMTFAQLLHQARAIGSCLTAALPVRGVAAVLMDGRAMDCIPAFLGVAYAGGAYAPLDSAMPAQRLEVILRGMKPDCIITDQKGDLAIAALEALAVPVFRFEEAVKTAIEQPQLDAVRARTSLDDPLSILYTSGSSGIPKGSVQSHSSYIHYTEATIDVFGFDETTVFGNQSPFFYANSIIDIYPPIALGARVYLLPANALGFPKRFVERLRAQQVSELTMTPSSFIALAESIEAGCLPHLKWGIMSGEIMPWRPLRAWMEAAPEAGFYNFYGSTEALSVATGRVEKAHEDGDLLPVGKPFRQAHIVFIDENGQEAEPQTGGEMLISSPWISSGYHRDQDRTEASFLTDPMQHGNFERFFRTGDIGRLNKRGELLVLGRRDSQIKHHGYRMEMREVEAALRSLPDWADGCVLFDGPTGELCCFWEGTLTKQALQSGLRRKLPRYMMPDRFIHLDVLPHTATMKLDRMALRKVLHDIP